MPPAKNDACSSGEGRARCREARRDDFGIRRHYAQKGLRRILFELA
jgi:hypothetical protein